MEEYVEDTCRVYLAPEASWGEIADAPYLDVFSLGAIAYHLFSGEPPAPSAVELHEKLRAGPGLRISDVMDGAGKGLQDLIQYSTVPDVSVRFASFGDFLKALDAVEDELTTPDPEATVDPSVATAGERIEGGFTVVRRLGKGSCSDVLLVKPDGSDEDLVLKVASDPAHNERLMAEGDILAKLRHPNVVEWRKTLTVSGRTALLMKKAGDTTLAQRLKGETRPSLDLIQRFGEELIQVIEYLEEEGVAHRDIKPENIGISQAGAEGRLQLVLFDFSLSRASPMNISAGTHPYLDPFLSARRPPRWDLYAERYALAVTLYEMVTGELPRWGDGRTQPAMLDCEVTMDTERFDPHLREGLTAFFAKALRRDYRERFDNAEDMRHAWRRAFEQPAVTELDAFETTARLAMASTTMAELGYSVEAQNVLEGMGIHTAKELLAVERIRFRYLTGVGDRIRKEIRLKAKRLAQLRPDLAQGRPTSEGAEPEAVLASLDELGSQLLPRRPAGDDRPEEHALAIYLGLEEGEPKEGEPPLWPTLGEAASQCRLSRSAVSETLLKTRERWLKSPHVTGVRADIAQLLVTHGGVMTVIELTQALLAARGSAQQDDRVRLRLAAAVARACLEAESALAGSRYQLFENGPVPLVATGSELADYAKRLARAADEAAQTEPLLAPQRATEFLEAAAPPDTITPLSMQRLLRLATAASQGAALSSRLEIYPRGMAASQAIKLSPGALAGPKFLTAEQVVERVRGRYPEAEPLPPRPWLDALLADAGANLVWKEAGSNGPGYYAAAGPGLSVGTSSYFVRHGTRSEQPLEVTEAIAAARQFEERLQYALRAGGFLALTVNTRLARHAESELLRRFMPERMSFDALLLSALHEQANAVRADWSVVLRADAATPGSRDWTNLMRLVQKAAARVKEQLVGRQKTVLLLHPGLLARYQLLSLVEELRDQAGRPGALPGLWLLIPMATHSLPAIDGVPVPVISSAQWSNIPQAWIENAHRAGTGAAV